jgi:hypothetical protein
VRGARVALFPSHPVGKFKAAFFARLGYHQDEWTQLADDLAAVASRNDAVSGQPSRFGNKYDFCYLDRTIRKVGPRRDRLDDPPRRARREIRHRISWSQTVNFEVLDTVVLERDLPEHGLRRGDLAAIVEVYQSDGLEVEFVRASGQTQALVELTTSDVRPIQDLDLIAVRTLAQAG